MTRRLALLIMAATVAILTGLAGGPPANAAYPGANGKIAWVTDGPAGSGTVDIWTMNPDGAQSTNLLPGDVIEEHPAWSPDGRRIAFSRPSSTPSGCFLADIYVMDADGSNVTQLTTSSLGTAATEPTWSPDGTRIAFTRGQQDATCNDGDSEIWVMNADGSGQTAVTSGGIGIYNGDGEPAWAPDGTRIAFTGRRPVANGSRLFGIFTINPDGSQLTRLTGAPISPIKTSSPAWSPDGQRIAYERKDLWYGSDEIWVMNADGSGQTAVTQNGFLSNWSPAWSPDGQQIAFSGQNDQTTFDNEIFVINVDGTGQTAITDNTVGDSFPDWQPLPASDDVVVTDCADPALAGLTVVAGDLIVQNVPDCEAISFPSLTEVGGDVTISGNDAATIIGMAELGTVAGDVTITGNGSAAEINLDALTDVGGAVSLSDNASAATIDLGVLLSAGEVTVTENDAAAVIGMAELGTVAGDVTITGNGSAAEINLDGLLSAGSVDVSDNSSTTVVSLGSLGEVAGDVELETAGEVIDMGGASVAGDVTLTGIGAGTVSATTGGGSTEVTVLGGTAAMRVFLPNGSFEQSVAFVIERQADGPVEGGTTAGGAQAAIDPLAGYRFSFAVPSLNQQAQLSFTVDLAQLNADTKAALLAGVADGSATLVVRRDEAGAVYQAFARCTGTQTPPADGCVAVVPLDLAGGPPAPGTEPAFIRFEGVAGSFSTWAVALVEPQDSTPPALTPTVSGTLGNGGWYTSDVTVSWTVADAESAITRQAGCGPQTVSADTAGVTFTCEATSAGGTATQSITVKRDATPPTISGTRNPAANASGWNNAEVTVSFGCADARSGVASCSAPTTISTEGPNQSVTGTASDAAGNQATATVGAINIDKTTPSCSASASPSTLWPPNHKLVTVDTAVSPRDALSGAAGYTLLSVTSNEPDNGPDDGDTLNDIQDFEPGNADTRGKLRAERSGSGSGRIYTLTYQVTDRAGNSATCNAQVAVPLD